MEATTKTQFVTPTCDSCGSHLEQEDQEQYCPSCGKIVAKETIKRHPERNFSDSNRSTGYGPANTQSSHDKGIGGTMVGTHRERQQAKSDSPGNRIESLHWQNRIRTADGKERIQKLANQDMIRMATAAGLPKEITETSAIIFRKAQQKGILRGRSVESVGTAALYSAIRNTGLPYTIDDLMPYCRLSDKLRVERAHRDIMSTLDLPQPPQQAETFIPRFASKLETDKENHLITLSKTVVSAARDQGLTYGKAPSTVAATALYIAILECKLDIGRVDLAKETNNTPNGIWKHTIEYHRAYRR